MNNDVEALLASQAQPVAAVARQLCERILLLYPDAVVTVDDRDIGFGGTTGYKGLVFVVSPHAKHVTLGIANGADLPDPAGLMEGSGKVHRHVKIRSRTELENPRLNELLSAALESRH